MPYTRKVTKNEQEKIYNLSTITRKNGAPKSSAEMTNNTKKLSAFLRNLRAQGVNTESNVKFFRNKTEKANNMKLKNMIAANIAKKQTIYKGRKIRKPCRYACAGEVCWSQGKGCPFVHKNEPGFASLMKKSTGAKSGPRITGK
jgi:hypothetical protein